MCTEGIITHSMKLIPSQRKGKVILQDMHGANNSEDMALDRSAECGNWPKGKLLQHR